MFEEFNATLDKLKKQDFEDVLSFKRACNFVEEKALHDNRLSKDVLLIYDGLLKKDLPEDVKNAICYNLGEMLHFQPELKADIKNMVMKHKTKIDDYVTNNTNPFSDGLGALSEDVSKDMQAKDLLIESKLKNVRKNFVSAPEPLPPITSELKPVILNKLNKEVEY